MKFVAPGPIPVSETRNETGPEAEPAASEPDPSPPSPGESPRSPVAYAELEARLLAPRCLKCHSFNPDLSMDEQPLDLSRPDLVIQNIEIIEKTVLIEASMPPPRDLRRFGPLTPEQRDLLSRWVEQVRGSQSKGF